MNKYALILSYNGNLYNGWQTQPEGNTVQDVLHEKLGLILRENLEIVGCGRTDAGVHAKNYVAHLESPMPLDGSILRRINGLLPSGIVIHEIVPVDNSFHARFDAVQRTYHYHLSGVKDPFRENLVTVFNRINEINFQYANDFLERIIGVHDFTTFCKTKSGNDHFICELRQAKWIQNSSDEWILHIAANRFLRGMVRLIVGASINLGLSKITVAQAYNAFEKKEIMPYSYSAPSHGLFLTEVTYPANKLHFRERMIVHE